MRSLELTAPDQRNFAAPSALHFLRGSGQNLDLLGTTVESLNELVTKKIWGATRSHRDSEKRTCATTVCVFFHTFYPRGKLTQKWSSPFWRGKSSRSLGHGFHSYVLLEGIQNHRNGRTPQSPSDSEFGSFNIRHDQNPKIQPPIIKDMENPWESPIDWRIFHDFPWFSKLRGYQVLGPLSSAARWCLLSSESELKATTRGTHPMYPKWQIRIV